MMGRGVREEPVALSERCFQEIFSGPFPATAAWRFVQDSVVLQVVSASRSESMVEAIFSRRVLQIGLVRD